MEFIAEISTDFPEKFGIPRQSGLVPGTRGRIRFGKKYRHPDAVKGLEEFSHIWLLWHFEDVAGEKWSATVRPPKIGGNRRVGVFATRSPFRPNPIGLSCVKLERVELTEEGPELVVSGADLKDGTKIYDIKPYLPYTDSCPDASAGFAKTAKTNRLRVADPGGVLKRCEEQEREVIVSLLAEDPRPGYHQDPERQYGMKYAGYNIHFRVEGEVAVIVDVVLEKSGTESIVG